MQVVLQETLVAAGGQIIKVTVTLPDGDQDTDTAWRHALNALAQLGARQEAQADSASVRPAPESGASGTLAGRLLMERRPRLADAVERPTNVVWTRPDLHGKTLKTVHRLALAIHELTEARRTPNVDNITAKARTSRPPVYSMADPETPAGRYMAPYVVSQKIGREIVLDLTPRGRQLVSLIRAGKVPA